MRGAAPNIVVVLVDQLRRDALGFYGDSNLRTPVIDRMAAEGLVFDAMSSTFPACVPFRFSFLTGEYAHSRMVPALGYRMSPAERTLGEAMQDCGYHTGYLGKWHLYSLYGIVGGQSLQEANRTPIPASHRRGFADWQGFELRNDFYDTHLFEGEADQSVPLEGYQTDALFQRARDWLSVPRDDPSFLILSVEAPHPPFTAPEEAIRRVASRGGYARRPNVDVQAIRTFPPEWQKMAKDGSTLDAVRGAERDAIFVANMQIYYAMIEEIDRNMGTLLKTVQEMPSDRETIVVFLSDHGELGGSHGMLGKGEPFEESIGVPFVLWSTDAGLVPPGRHSDIPLCTEDLFPTVVGLGGGASPNLPGLDVSGFVTGQGALPDRDGVLLEFTAELRPNRRYHDETWRGIRTRDTKYTVLGNATNGVRPWMLHDLATDPFEQRNLIEQDPERVRDMHQKLIRLLAEAGDDYPITDLAF
ncbi:sulfatase-like hydrolase/transferase [Primorskyibacter marinus]|uniref:sulfatase-like hydrolase/transferase n=1 Tax=Primorskyibacter marinus TaxID=1977320 RepID=UPI000E307C96|nr:sulfatase-like hydrolase/transferase [Primorskyibacter marinus]